MNTSTLEIRNIKASDNAALAAIVRGSLEEFGANHAGTVYYDASTDYLYELFQTPGSCYFVVELEGNMVGGAGIFPTKALPVGVCELVKMYLLKDARGKGIGKKLLHTCFAKAKEMGYTKMYLETMPELTLAIPMYEQQGFEYLTAPMGESGHFGCAIQMLKIL